MMILEQKKTVLPRKLLVFIFSFLMISVTAVGQEYPFKNLPSRIQATLDVNTSKTETYNNLLLGTNISQFRFAPEREIVKKLDPITIRFPQGIYSNWYRWRDDEYVYYYPWPYNHEGDVERERVLKPGASGLKVLNDEVKAENAGKGYDFLITWNMSDDGQDWNDNSESIARFNDYESKGFNVRAIEMGNELFYRNQRSPIIPSEEEYVLRAKSMSKAIKEINKDVKFSIPLKNSGSATNPNWNKLLTDDKSYFDAVTIHKYVGSNIDDPNDTSRLAYEYGLAGRLELHSGVTFARKLAQDKPVWLTEWAVRAGRASRGNAASYLGMADCYIYLSENQDIYERANWFNTNKSANQHILIVDGTRNNVVEPHQKTGYGTTHALLRTVFENSTMLDVNLNTPTKLVLGDGQVNAVSARAVIKDGETLIFAVNLTDKPADFKVNMNGELYSGGYKLEAIKYNNLAEQRSILWDESPYNHVENGSGTVELPPLSISIITLNETITIQKPVVAITSPTDNATLKLSDTIPLIATATDADGTVSKVNFFVNGALNKSDFVAPYESSFVPIEAGIYTISARAFDNDNNYTDALITINVVKQEPYNGSPIAIPGTIEAEDFDKGGQGISYNDSDTENKGGEYRLTEGVDIGTGGSGFTVGYTVGGEWLEYSIDVAEDGLYDFEFHVSSKNGGGQLSLSIDNETVLGTNNVPSTTDWNTYEVFTEQVTLQKGESVLRLDIVKTGFNIDKIVAKKANITGDDHSVFGTEISIYPNPNETGLFRLSRSEEWEVYSIQGVFVAQGKGDTVNLTGEQKGVYFIKLNSIINKIIIQ